MKRAIVVTAATFVFALVGLAVACVYGFREDVGTPVGGVAGFASAVLLTRGRFADKLQGHDEFTATAFYPEKTGPCELLFLPVSMVAFSFVGWLTGYLHMHGEQAGAVCGLLGGYMLASTLPALFDSRRDPLARTIQLGSSAAALLLMLGVIWMMYSHLFR